MHLERDFDTDSTHGSSPFHHYNTTITPSHILCRTMQDRKLCTGEQFHLPTFYAGCVVLKLKSALEYPTCRRQGDSTSTCHDVRRCETGKRSVLCQSISSVVPNNLQRGSRKVLRLLVCEYLHTHLRIGDSPATRPLYTEMHIATYSAQQRGT